MVKPIGEGRGEGGEGEQEGVFDERLGKRFSVVFEDEGFFFFFFFSFFSFFSFLIP